MGREEMTALSQLLTVVFPVKWIAHLSVLETALATDMASAVCLISSTATMSVTVNESQTLPMVSANE